jgi:hypothetical protein
LPDFKILVSRIYLDYAMQGFPMRHRINTDANIIPLFGQDQNMKDKIIKDLFAYWDHLRGERLVPTRSEIDPRKIKGTLEHTFILEAVKNGSPRFRLAGIEVCDLLGMELRGMPISALFEPVDREILSNIVANVLQGPQIAQLRLEGQLAGGRSVLGHMILMPLRDENRNLTRILGAATLDRELMRPPVRFTIKSKHITRIVSKQDMPLDIAVEGGMAEPSRRFIRETKRPPTNGQRPNLTIVK